MCIEVESGAGVVWLRVTVRYDSIVVLFLTLLFFYLQSRPIRAMDSSSAPLSTRVWHCWTAAVVGYCGIRLARFDLSFILFSSLLVSLFFYRTRRRKRPHLGFSSVKGAFLTRRQQMDANLIEEPWNSECV